MFGSLFDYPEILEYYCDFVRRYNRRTGRRVPVMRRADIKRLVRNRVFWDLYFVRRYAGAKLVYETILHGGDPAIYQDFYKGDVSDLKRVYRELFSRAYGFDIGDEGAMRYLTDVDPFFYSADYTRSFFLSDQLVAHFRSQ